MIKHGELSENPEKDLGFTQKLDHNFWCLLQHEQSKELRSLQYTSPENTLTLHIPKYFI